MKYHMNHNTCILCIGSNYERNIHIADARSELAKHFTGIRFGEEMETEAVGKEFLSPFSNQLAILETDFSLKEIRDILKEIERKNGRLPSDKTQGIVKLDIDILIFNQDVLKKEDLQRKYIQEGLKNIR